MGRANRTLAAVAITLAGCTAQVLPAATPVTPIALRLYATSAAAPLLANVTAAYSRANPGVRFDVGIGEYNRLEDRLFDGEIGYFLSNHLPLDRPARPLWAAPIGQDGIAIVVHPDNPVAELTTERLREIYQGWSRRWIMVGGTDRPIAPITYGAGSGMRAEFETLIMGSRPTTPHAEMVPNPAAMILAVSRQPDAIGYVPLHDVEATVRALPIDGVPPSAQAVLEQRYPLRSILYIVGREEPQDEAMRAFIAWLQSPPGQAVVAQGYVPLG